MDVRAAVASDADEVVRLATIMFESMGVPTGSAWSEAASRQVTERLGDDLAVFVVDHPDHADRLVASTAGTVSHRLPGRPTRAASPGTSSGCASIPTTAATGWPARS